MAAPEIAAASRTRNKSGGFGTKARHWRLSGKPATAVNTNRQTQGRGCGCGTLGPSSPGRFSPAPPNGRFHRHSAPDVNLKPGDFAESRSFLTKARIVGT
jgi:hypothetical protein